jgi:hypothetical protein
MTQSRLDPSDPIEESVQKAHSCVQGERQQRIDRQDDEKIRHVPILQISIYL